MAAIASHAFLLVNLYLKAHGQSLRRTDFNAPFAFDAPPGIKGGCFSLGRMMEMPRKERKEQILDEIGFFLNLYPLEI